MFKKFTLTLSVIALALALGAVNVFADGGGEAAAACPAIYDSASGTWTSAYICDGRLNAWDLTAPIAVYYDHTNVPVWVATTDDDGETVYEQQMERVVSAISVWAIDANGVGQEAMIVPMTDVTAAITAGADATISQQNGITLGYSANGYLYLSAPNGYTFYWEA